jgi:diguanylate cyclase (GGDEF)-like protein
MQSTSKLQPVGLRQTILLRMALLVTGVLVVVSALLIGLGIRPLMSSAADSLFSGAADRVVSSLQGLKVATTRALSAGQIWWQHQVPNVDDPKPFNAFFMPLLAADPLATSVVAGTENGQGWMLLQLGDGRWRNRLTDVPRWGQTQRILIHQADGQATTENQQQDYDARARPWYLAARALGSDADVAWTAPYTFFTTGDPGVTAAVRLPATGHLPAGALGVDLKLRDLSQVTMSASLGARGMALVLTEDERVLALPRAPAGTDAKNWANLVLRDTPALGLPAVDAAVALWRQGGHQPLQVQDVGVSGTRWLVSAIPYALGSQRLWVFTLAPAADFSPAWGRLFLLLGAAVLVLLIPVVWLARDQARRIVEPLEALARQSERIGQLDFSQPPAEVNTPVRELRQLSDAQEHMRQLLQTHQHELDDHIRALELAQGEIHQLAFFDPLTRLPNRRLFMDRLGLALARCARAGQVGALLFIDLDNFKTLNDTMGHAAGDTLLQLVASRLVQCVRQTDSVSRFGGDEFLVMLEDLAPGQVNAMEVARREARQVAQKVLAELGQPAQLLGSEFVTTPSIGVVLFQGREKPDDLLKWADMAMYQAKAAGRNSVRFFDPDFQAQAEQRVQIEVDLRQALRASEFQMWLQPQFDRERRVVGAEALLRWPQPQRGWVSPVDFIPVAESSGLIVALGQWVLEQACLQLALWAQDPRSASWTLSVNVSARQFRHPDFVSHTLALLQRTGANPSRLRLELTESMLLDDVAQTIERMDLLQQQGIDFSLDDFGTGYSSLSYLKQLPFVELKVDKSFVRDLLVDVNDAVLTRTMIVLAHALGLSVLAEGVETAAQFDALAEQGCDLFQGYLLGRPVDVTAFDARWRIFG